MQKREISTGFLELTGLVADLELVARLADETYFAVSVFHG
jgi:hypothetical protein